jgi:signal transduction histidine kinase
LDRGTPHFSVDGQFLGYFGGCAETERLPQAALNSQLRTGLAGVSTFARDLAQAQLTSAVDDPVDRTPLKVFARNLRTAEGERAQEMQHAAGELQKLAADMLAYADISNDACLK